MIVPSIIAGTFLVIVVLGAMSLDYVEQNEYGLVYNWITKTIGKRVYHGGTHSIGFWNKFVVFPATVQSIEFSNRRWPLAKSPTLHTRTKEGLGLQLSISFQYTLDPERLPELYALTNIAYEGLFVRIARDQLLEAAAEYEGPQYWLQRQDVGDQMRTLVDGKLQKSCAKLWGLQLLVIDLPDRYEQAITLTQVQQQIIKTRRNEQKAASIRADTEVLKADYDRQIRVVGASAEANYTVATKLAMAEAAGRKIAAEADAVKYVRTKLHLSPEGAVQFQQLNAFGNLPNATFLANLPEARAMVGMGGAAIAPAFLQQGSTRQHWQGQQQHKEPPRKTSVLPVSARLAAKF